MGLGDLLGGKTKTYKKDPLADDINAAGKLGIGQMTSATNELNDKVYGNAENFIDSQIGLENKMLRGSTADANRSLSKMIAQRGMGNSSIGMGEQINQERQLSDKIAMNTASSGSRLKDLLNEKLTGGSSLWNVKASQGPVQMQDIKQKQGGLMPLIGAGVGGYLGGASGAQVGMGLGQYLSA